MGMNYWIFKQFAYFFMYSIYFLNTVKCNFQFKMEQRNKIAVSTTCSLVYLCINLNYSFNGVIQNVRFAYQALYV